MYLLALPKLIPFCSPFSNKLDSSERLCRAAGSDVLGVCGGVIAADADTFLAAGDVGDANCSRDCEAVFRAGGVFSEVLRDCGPPPTEPLPPAEDSYTNM